MGSYHSPAAATKPTGSRKQLRHITSVAQLSGGFHPIAAESSPVSFVAGYSSLKQERPVTEMPARAALSQAAKRSPHPKRVGESRSSESLNQPSSLEMDSEERGVGDWGRSPSPAIFPCQPDMWPQPSTSGRGVCSAGTCRETWKHG